MLRFREHLLSSLFFVSFLCLFFALEIFAQDYRSSRNFDLSSSSRVGGEEIDDGELSEEAYLKKREEYLRKFKKNNDKEVYEKEKARYEAARKEKKWKENQAIAEKLEKKPVVPDSGEDLARLTKGLQERPQEMLKEIENIQKRIKNGNVDLDQVVEVLNKVPGMKHSEVNVPSKYQGQVAELLYKSLHPLREMPQEELANQLTKQLEGNPLGSILESQPQLTKTAVEVIQDPEALPEMSLIAANKTKLIWFAIFNVLLFIVGFLWKKRIKKSDLPFVRSFPKQLIRFLSITTARVGLLIVFYGENLYPLWNVMMN